jgi:SnoaL-like domain
MPEAYTLDQLLAREQIRDLVSRYVVALDSYRFDDVAELFDPQTDSDKYGKGRAGVRAWYERVHSGSPNPSGLYNNISAHQIDLIDDDHATGVCYLLGVGVTGTTWQMLGGIYSDRYIRRGDRWYFARRTWARVGGAELEASDFGAAPWLPTTADVWELYRQDRAARKAPAGA